MALSSHSKLYPDFVSTNQMRLMSFCDDYLKIINRDTSFINLDMLLTMHHFTTAVILESAGKLRDEDVSITYSIHQPPPHQEVRNLTIQFLEVLRELFANHKDPFDVSAFALWRLNWIHPFMDGNGRVSRALAYTLLTSKLGKSSDKILLPELIEKEDKKYQNLLRQTDLIHKDDYKFDREKIKPLSNFLAELYHFAFLNEILTGD